MFLTNWVLQFNVNRNAVSSLLRGLKRHKCFNNLPINSRTLMSTPTQTSNKLIKVDLGIYHHFGLSVGIIKYAPANIHNIQIAG